MQPTFKSCSQAFWNATFWYAKINSMQLAERSVLSSYQYISESPTRKYFHLINSSQTMLSESNSQFVYMDKNLLNCVKRAGYIQNLCYHANDQT